MELIVQGEGFSDQLYPAWELAEKIVTAGGAAKIIVTQEHNGILPLPQHWWHLMGEMAGHLRRSGTAVTATCPDGSIQSLDLTKANAHTIFTNQFLPVDPATSLRKTWFHDVRAGRIPATTLERVAALEKLYAYAGERNWRLSVFPRSEYEQYQQIKEIWLNETPKEHMDRVQSLGCIACRKDGHPGTPAEIHHVRVGQGAAQRASDDETLPLCPRHHRKGGYGVAIHAGQKKWEEKYGTETELLQQVDQLLVLKILNEV